MTRRKRKGRGKKQRRERDQIMREREELGRGVESGMREAGKGVMTKEQSGDKIIELYFPLTSSFFFPSSLPPSSLPPSQVKERRYIENPDYSILQDSEAARIAWALHKKRNDSIIVDLFQVYMCTYTIM